VSLIPLAEARLTSLRTRSESWVIITCPITPPSRTICIPNKYLQVFCSAPTPIKLYIIHTIVHPNCGCQVAGRRYHCCFLIICSIRFTIVEKRPEFTTYVYGNTAAHARNIFLIPLRQGIELWNLTNIHLCIILIIYARLLHHTFANGYLF
jgi:hypothetical protein